MRPTVAATIANWMGRGAGALRARSGAGLAIADQAVVSISNFATIYLLARTMPSGEFGFFVLAHTTVLLVTSLHNALLVEPQNVIGSRLDGVRYKTFLGTLTFAHLLWAMSALVLGLLVAIAAWALGATRTASISAMLGLTIVPWLAQEFIRRALYVRSKVTSALINDLVCYGLQLLAVVVLVSALGGGGPVTEQALAVLGLSSLVAAIVGTRQLRRAFGTSGWIVGAAERRQTWDEVWGLGKWLLGRNVVTWMGTNGHAWLVAALLGPGSLGVYRATIHLVNVINPLRQAAINYLPPRANRVYHSTGIRSLSRWVVRISAGIGLVLLPAVALFVIWPDWVISLAYGDKLSGEGLGSVLALAAAAQMLTFFKFPMDVAVVAMGGARQMFLISAIPVLLLLTAGVALIMKFGIVGVAMSSLVIAVTLLIATYALYKRSAAPKYKVDGHMEQWT